MEILQKLRNFWILFLIISVVGCSSTPGVKVYQSMPSEGALVRTQAGEKIPYAESADFLCVSKDDFKKLTTAIKYKRKNEPIRYNSSY